MSVFQSKSRGLRAIRWGLVVGVVTMFGATGCGDDDTSPTPDGSAGKGGNSSGGKNTHGGEAPTAGTTAHVGGAGGAPEAGAGPVTNGGMGGDGGVVAVGGAAGGEGGAGGEANLCGNHHVDAGEECDDGNTANLDGCSFDCKSKCETCLSTLLPTGSYQSIKDKCLHDATKAVDGPAAGTARSTLCVAAYDCMAKTGCQSEYEDCYCGASDALECDSGGPNQAGNPQGPCVKEFQAAAESRTSGDIQVRFSNVTLALGRAVFLHQPETNPVCSLECQLGQKKSKCDACALGANPGPAYENAICNTCRSGTACAALVDCTATNCDASELGPCLYDTSATGVCKDQLALGSANDVQCLATNCWDECFDGAGGAGGGASQ